MSPDKSPSKKRWTRQDLIDNLIKGGLKRGDTAVMYSSIMDFGIPELNGEHICQFYLDALFSILGEEGILVMTAYSYSFCDGRDFDPWTTRSTVNVIANYCIDHGIGVRTVDPVFSYVMVTLHDLRLYQQQMVARSSQPGGEAATGLAGFVPFSSLESASADNIQPGCASPDSAPSGSHYHMLRTLRFTNDCLRFDAPSVTAFLLERKARYVMLGWIYYMTFIHNVERKIGSPYRFFKQFSGQVKTRYKGSLEQDAEQYDCYYYVRMFCDNTVVDKARCYQGLAQWPDFNQGPDSCIYLPLGPSHMICADFEYMVRNIEQTTRDDPWWYCCGPALDSQELELLNDGGVEEDQMVIREYPVADLNDRLFDRGTT